MDLTQLFDDDRAVSPVIGVILMVAITVILAAVIGTFVLGLGNQVSTTTPSASFQFDYSQTGSSSNDTLEVAHAGGDSIKANQLNASVSGAVTKNNSNPLTFAGNLYSGSDDVTAGSTDTINGASFSGYAGDNYVDLSGATVRVIWSASSGDSSAVLGRWTGPDAS